MVTGLSNEEVMNAGGLSGVNINGQGLNITVEQCGSSVKALRAKFQQVIFATLAANHPAGAGAGFYNLCFDARFAQRVGAHQAGYSRADNQRWDVSGHGNDERMELMLQSF